MKSNQPDITKLQQLAAALEEHVKHGTLTFEIWAETMREVLKTNTPGYSATEAFMIYAEPDWLERL